MKNENADYFTKTPNFKPTYKAQFSTLSDNTKLF